MNYATLSQAIKDWLSKDTIGSVLPLIIKFGQQDLEDQLRIRAMEYKPVNATISAGTASLAVPDDYLELMYLTLIEGTTRNPVDFRWDTKEMHRIAVDTAETGLPRRITRVAEVFYFDVTTDSDYSREWAYYRRLTTLSATAPNNTNWWSEKAEEALLMACLNKASRYLSGIPEGDKKKWRSAADETRDALFLNEKKEETGGSVLRTEGWIL